MFPVLHINVTLFSVRNKMSFECYIYVIWHTKLSIIFHTFVLTFNSVV